MGWRELGRGRRLHGRVAVALVVVAAGLLAPASAGAATAFSVTDPTDAALATATDTQCVSTDGGACTLRAAIQAADNVAGTSGDLDGKSTITLPAGTFKLTIPATSGFNTDDPATGDLDIDFLNGAHTAPQITITGAGPDSTIIDANSIDRAFTLRFPSSLSISGVTIEGGAPSSHAYDHFNGGAINASGPLTIRDSMLDGNSSGGEGGAVYSTADVTVLDSTLANNVAPTAGGALTTTGGVVVQLVDDTFDGNKATGGTGAGGALAYLSAAAAGSQILNVTVAHNTAPDGGGIYNASNAVAIENTIVAENSGTGSVGGAAGCYGLSVNNNGADEAAGADLGGNVDSDGTCFSPTITRDLTSTDPKLAALGDNGGQTPTDALLAGSPAIGHAIASGCPTSDQRGVAHLSTFCDPGAYQTIDADLALTAAGPSTVKTGQQIIDTFTVSNNGPYAATDATVSDSIPLGSQISLDAVTASQGTCSTVLSASKATTTCSLGMLNSALSGGAQSATVTVKLTPGQTGTVSPQASVSASALDPSAANNSATVNTTVTRGPVNNALPQITGTPLEGATLTATTGTWTNTQAHTKFAYQWQDCTDIVDCTDIDAATAKTYRLTSDDVGAHVVVIVTATNPDGSTTAASDLTDPVKSGLRVTVGDPQTNGTTATLPVDCHSITNVLSCELTILLTALGATPGHAVDAVTAATAHPGKHPAKVVVLGTEKVRIRRGHSKTVRITLNRTGRRLLAKHHRLKVKIVITEGRHTLRTRTITFKR